MVYWMDQPVHWHSRRIPHSPSRHHHPGRPSSALVQHNPRLRPRNARARKWLPSEPDALDDTAARVMGQPPEHDDGGVELVSERHSVHHNDFGPETDLDFRQRAVVGLVEQQGHQVEVYSEAQELEVYSEGQRSQAHIEQADEAPAAHAELDAYYEFFWPHAGTQEARSWDQQ